MLAISVASGSNGNCIYVEAGGLRLLIDAGISGSQAAERLALRGRDIRKVDALLVTHDHGDHSRSVGIFQRMFGMPIHITPRTLETATKRHRLGRMSDIRYFQSGGAIDLGDVRVETIPTPHDSADSVGFVIDDGERRLGILTDLGHVFPLLPKTLATLDAVFLESNYDPEMLDNGPYPPFLKHRVRGPEGHISNLDAAELTDSIRSTRLQWVCLAHLSQQNNTPEVAMATHRAVRGPDAELHLASRYEVGEELHVA